MRNAMSRGVPIALEFLEDREIVRQRIDPDTRGHVWLLDHDYLTNGILEADRRANVWPSLLQEKFRSFEDAGARYGRKWWALLSPVQQVGLFSQYLQGRLRYGRFGFYALLSLTRWTPYLLLVFLCIFGWQWSGRTAASPARPRRGPRPPFRGGYEQGMGCALYARRQPRHRSIQFLGTGPCRSGRLSTYRLASQERTASARRPRPRSKEKMSLR